MTYPLRGLHLFEGIADYSALSLAIITQLLYASPCTIISAFIFSFILSTYSCIAKNIKLFHYFIVITKMPSHHCEDSYNTLISMGTYWPCLTTPVSGRYFLD